MEKVYTIEPDSPETLNLLGDYFFTVADFGLSEAAYRKSVETNPDDLTNHEFLLRYHYLRSNTDQAIALAESILEADPQSIRALETIVDIYLGQYRITEAEEWISQMEAYYPEEHFTLTAKGDRQFYEYEFDAAVELYRDSLEVFPHSVHTQYMIGRSYDKMNDCERSLIHFQDLVESYPDVLAYQMGEAGANLCNGKIERASAQFEDVIRADRNNASAYLGSTFIYLQQSRWEEAFEGIVEVLKLSPEMAVIHASLGELLYYEGDYDAAEEELRRALELDPYLIDASTLLTSLLIDQGRLSEAEATIQAAADKNPHDLGVKFMLGLVYYIKGDNFNTSKYMNQVLEGDPEFYSAHLYLGLSKRNMADYEGAEKSIENYLALGEGSIPDNEVFMLSGLLEALDQGYTLTQEYAMESTKDLMALFELPPMKTRFEDIPGKGRTMVVDLNLNNAELGNETFVVHTSVVLAANALFLPRAYPEVDGGLRMVVIVNGREMFYMDAPMELISRYADTLIDGQTMFLGMEFNLTREMTRSKTFSGIFKDTAELRDLDALSVPPQTVITTEEIKAEVSQGVDEQLLQEIQLEESFLRLLDLVPENYDHAETWVETYGEGIAGFYVPEDNQVFMVRQEELSAAEQVTLSHEGVHALQHQEFDLTGYDDADLNDDERLAYLSLVEGDATLTSLSYLEEYIPMFDRVHMAWVAAGVSEETERSTPDFLHNLRLFPYTYGYSFVQALYDRGGWEEVNKAYQNPPVSSEQIMHPWAYLSPDADSQPAKVDLAGDLEALDPDWEVLDHNVLGEYGIYLLMSEYFGGYAAEEAAYGWRGDEYALLHNRDTDSMFLVMQIKWDYNGDNFMQLFKIAMLHRPEYSMLVEEFIPKPQYQFTWTNGEEYIRVHTRANGTFIYIGPNLEELNAIAETLN